MCRRNEQYNDAASQNDAPGRREIIIIKKGRYKYGSNSALVRENYAKLARSPFESTFCGRKWHVEKLVSDLQAN